MFPFYIHCFCFYTWASKIIFWTESTTGISFSKWLSRHYFRIILCRLRALWDNDIFFSFLSELFPTSDSSFVELLTFELIRQDSERESDFWTEIFPFHKAESTKTLWLLKKICLELLNLFILNSINATKITFQISLSIIVENLMVAIKFFKCVNIARINVRHEKKVPSTENFIKCSFGTWKFLRNARATIRWRVLVIKNKFLSC